MVASRMLCTGDTPAACPKVTASTVTGIGELTLTDPPR
jgi:hypothetical protein